MAGIYFGKPRGFGTNDNGEETGFNTEVYSASEVTHPNPPLSPKKVFLNSAIHFNIHAFSRINWRWQDIISARISIMYTEFFI
jgi:hypothetical protein